jgi:hypothetical protein
MMKRESIMSHRITGFACMVAVIIFFSSCLKDNGPIQDFSQSPALVGFQYTGNSAFAFSQSVLPQPGDSVQLEVTLSVASLTLSTPVSATIAPDQPTLDTYNGANSTNYVQISSAAYTLANGGVVTIKPGQQIVKLLITIDGTQIDFSQSNALALKITSAQGAKIATNLNWAIYLLKLRNIYEGNYALSGNRIGYSGPTAGSPIAFTVPLSGNYLLPTVSINSVTAPLADLGGLTILLTINGSNAVTVTDDPSNPSGFAGEGNDGAPSTYDPVTHTFDLHYKYINGAGNLRHIDEKLVLNP